jgi:tRNA pseudouridine38-40 synthase
MLAPYVWSYSRPLDLTLLQNTAEHIRGTHDFTSFAAVDPDLATRGALNDESLSTENVTSNEGSAPSEKTAIRTIHDSEWRRDEHFLIYRVSGTGFLHHMVRNLVGTFVEAAAQRIPVDSIPTILAARNRSAAGPTAPARGLFLIEVEY